MTIEEAARIIEAEASVLNREGKIAVAQCIVDNNYNSRAFTAPAETCSAESMEAAMAVIVRGERRFPQARLLQFRSFSKYGPGGVPDWPKIWSSVPRDLEYLGKDGAGDFGHYYFGRRIMRRWDEAVKTALTAHYQSIYYDHFVYLYGAKGITLREESQIRELFKMEPQYFSRYSDAEKYEIIKNSIGKIAYDCSGFVGWLCTGDMRYSTAQFENSHDKTQDTRLGPAGSILYTTYGGTGRHIGLDVGQGFCCDMAYESTDKNIREHKAGVRFYPIRAGICPWEWSAQSNVLDYTGASAA